MGLHCRCLCSSTRRSTPTRRATPSATAGSFRSFDNGHGSSHTSYLVQSPFQGQGSQHNAYYAVPAVVYHVSPYDLPRLSTLRQVRTTIRTHSGPLRILLRSRAWIARTRRVLSIILCRTPPRQSLYSNASLDLRTSKSQRSLADPDHQPRSTGRDMLGFRLTD